MKYFLFLLLFVSSLIAQDLHCDTSDPFINTLTYKEMHKVMKESFDTIIDLYLISSKKEKLDFIATLEDYEVENFMTYLQENYPDEFKAIP